MPLTGPPGGEGSPPSGAASLRSRLSMLLLEPSGAVVGGAERRKARLLATFLLSLMALFAATNLSYLLFRSRFALSPSDLMGYLLLIGSYTLSRTRHVAAATVTLLSMFPIVVFANVLEGTTFNVTASLAFLLPGYVLASIFLATRAVVAYGTVVTAGILMLPLLAPRSVPGVAALAGTVAAGAIVIALLVIAMRHRDMIEQDHQEELKDAYDHALEGWARALEMRDKETEGHSRRVTSLAVRLAAACGLSGEALHDMHRGALLHDIGKMAIPDEVLLKAGALSDAERDVMQTHTTIASQMLTGVPFLEPALAIALYHHERWDGSGYPKRLREEEIPLTARIFAVVDVWDALLSNRPYRGAATKAEAAEYLREQRGRQFDPLVVDRFLELEL
jgi:putative nucleotidyltransferase with HDIG domain